MQNNKYIMKISFIIILIFVNSYTFAGINWIGSQLGGDGFSWSSPQNWSTNFVDFGPVPGSSDFVEIHGNFASSCPVVQSATIANPFGIWCGYNNSPGIPTVSVNWNGSLNLVNFDLGFVADGKLIVNGGNVSIGAWGLHIGTGNEWGYGHGTIDIFSGKVETESLSFGSYTNSVYAGGSGSINIYSGLLYARNVDHLDTTNSVINIESGKFIIDGDVTSLIGSLVSSGHIIAFDGSGSIVITYDSSKTIVTAVDNSSSSAKPKWWDNFPRIVETTHLQTALDHHANIGMNAAQQDPGWALYGQKVTEVPSRTEAFHNAGLKSIGYFETFGDSYCFIAELDNPSQSTNYNTINCNHWNWQNYSGGKIVWIGMKNFWDNETFAQPWTRTHPTYSGPVMTYPNGNIATGYFGNTADPRNNLSYDASTSKDILGNENLFYGYSSIPNTNGALYIPESGKWATFVGFAKDSACPQFPDFTLASTHYAADMGMDGMWSDNFSPWDSFGNSPVTRAFGDWSIALFRNYLSNNFTPAELSAMGVSDVTTFDVRDKLKSIATGWGWDSSSLNHAAWRDSRWQNENIWQAYSIFKRQTGTEALSNYYNAAHYAAQLAGKNDFLVQGNDIPILSLGWPRGSLDMVSTEMSAGWNLCSGSRGFMLPPVGRFAPPYKVAREHAKSRFVNVWFYNDSFESYTFNTNLCQTLYYEMLANHTLPMFHPGNSRVFGADNVNADFFNFVAHVETNFGTRIPVEDIGIYYSSSSILNQMFPGGVKNFNSQPHQFALWGWATALEELQYQHKVIVEWNLNSTALKKLKVFIIPEAEIFTENDANNILYPWVTNGGRLIITGISGNRRGEKNIFEINPNGYSLKNLTGVSNISSAPNEDLRTVGNGKVLYIKNNIGLDFFAASTLSSRENLLTNFSSAMNQVLGNNRELTVLIPGAGITNSVGLTVFADESASNLFIDIVNYNLDLDSDQMTDTPQLIFTVNLPEWIQGSLTAVVFSPQSSPPSIQINSVSIDRAEITIGPVQHYASVKITHIIPEPFYLSFIIYYLLFKIYSGKSNQLNNE